MDFERHASSLPLNDHKAHLLIGASGSVAVVKLPLMIKTLSEQVDLSIRIILTSASAQFFNGSSEEQPSLADLAVLPNVDALYLDQDEWCVPWTRGQNILHIELRRWADVLVIAPLSANSLAKITAGICDNLLTCVVRAWEVSKNNSYTRPIIVAPAMNSAMWNHPITAKQIHTLEFEWGLEKACSGQGWFEVLYPQTKLLACGDTGPGGMHDFQAIVQKVLDRLITSVNHRGQVWSVRPPVFTD